METDILPLDGAMCSASPPPMVGGGRGMGTGGEGWRGLEGESRMNPNTEAASHSRRISNDVFYSS